MKQSMKTLLYGFDKEQFLLPFGFWALFFLLSVLFFEDERSVNAAGGFLGYLLPLLMGILAAYTLLSDPILELRFSTSRSSSRLLVERVLLLFGFLALLALSFQGAVGLVGIDLGKYGNFFQIQLIWLIPCAFAISIGSMGSLLACNPITGAGIAGGVWILQILMRGWFSQNELGQYVFLFQGMMRAPGSAELVRNQISLAIITIVFLAASGLLLKRQERYIK